MFDKPTRFNTVKAHFYCNFFVFGFFGQQAEVHRTVKVGILYSKTAEVNGTKPKSLRYRRAECLTGSKRAEQWKNPYSALKGFL